MPDDTTETITKIGAALLGLFIFTILLSTLFGSSIIDINDRAVEAVDTYNRTGEYVTVGDELTASDQLTVRSSRGYALFFNETDSVESSGPTNLTDDSWSVCAAPQLDGTDTAPTNATYDVWAYENETIVIQLDAGTWVAYYNNSTMDAMAHVPATTPRDGFRPICTRYENETGTLWLRAPGGWDSDQMDSTIDARNVSLGWIGRIDEVRTFRTNISNSTIGGYANDQIQPLPGTDRASRMLFDEGSGDTATVYIDGSEASIEGAKWATGIPNHPISRGTDYELASEPLRIQTLAGGYMGGAPVIFVSGQGHWWALLDAFTTYGTTALTLIALGVLIYGAGYAMDRLSWGGSR